MNVPRLNGFLQISAIGLALVALPAASMDTGTATGLQAGGGSDAAPQAMPGMPTAMTSSQLFARYRAFIGSDAGTRSVIQGLRYAELISLGGEQSGSAGAKFLPPTRPMGWGGIDRALGLAQRELASLGITQPTAAQLKAALVGGSLVAADGGAVDVRGVLTLRSQSMGWGGVAHSVDASAGGRTGTAMRPAGDNAGMTVSGSGLKQDSRSPERVRATFAAANSNRAGGFSGEGDHGAIVTAGGSLKGDGARTPDSRPGAVRFGVESGAGIDGEARGLHGLPATGATGAWSAGAAGSATGGTRGPSAGAGLGLGLGLGRR